MRQINGANSRMLARITGKTIPQEARPLTCSFNLVRAIRKCRLKWLGDILRNGPDRITYQAVKEQRNLGLPGNLLMDAPPHSSLEELVFKAKDRGNWRILMASILWVDNNHDTNLKENMIQSQYDQLGNFPILINIQTRKRKSENYFRKFSFYIV